jgi:hypothetical protein
MAGLTVRLITPQPLPKADEWWDEVTLCRVERVDEGYSYTARLDGRRITRNA